jgi:hypothetical protein
MADMTEEVPFYLKQTNVSHPQLAHSASKQSIAASEGYYSLHSGSEAASSDGDDPSKRRFQTPPSHTRTPVQSHEQLLQHPPAAVTSLKGVGIPRHNPQPAPPTQDHRIDNPFQMSTVSPITEERPETQKGIHSPPRRAMDSASLATTPEVDDTPYIRFAIDQLTRDEEVRGSRLYPQVAEDEDYPVERIISDDGLGYMQQEQERQERQHRISHPPPPRPQERTIPRKPITTAPVTTTPVTTTRDVFVSTSLDHAPLRFLPAILQPFWLGTFIFVCLLMLAGLIFCAVYSNRDQGYGLWDYMSFGDSRYFIFEYLPTLLGMIILMWLLQIQIALRRIVPFISMASDNHRQRSEAIFLELQPMQFLLPKVEHFRAGQPLIGSFYLVCWLFLWTIPLLASSFNVRSYYDIRVNLWRWIAVQGVIWTVAALYILLIIAVLVLMVFLMRKQTGLKWDPRSLADIIALLERSNVTTAYDGSETFDKSGFRRQLGRRGDRIGYWATTKQSKDVFHGIGEEGAATRRYSLEQGQIREKKPERADPAVQQPIGDFSIRMDIRDPQVRLKYLPWYLRDSAVIAWIVIAMVLLIAFYVVSYINSAVRFGFLPQVLARTAADGFSASNFLYSFVPAFIATVLFLIILTLDYSMRTLRPFISLSSKGGATAEHSLLVDYSARLPLSVTLAALENKHYQSAVLSFISLCSTALPILAGGCFWTQFYPGENNVRVAADLSGYYALCFFLALAALSFLALLPGRRRAALPHRNTSLAEIISWVYQSPLLADRAFARPQTKPELVARLMGTAYTERTWAQSVASLVRPSRQQLRDDANTDSAAPEKTKSNGKRANAEKHNSVMDPGSIRYGFGIHVGRDGLEHLGIDRVRRGGERSGRELVIFEEQKRRSWAASV